MQAGQAVKTMQGKRSKETRPKDVGRAVASNIRLRKEATARHVEAATLVPAQPVKSIV